MSIPNLVTRVESAVLGVGKAMIQADPTSDLLEDLDLLRGQRDQHEEALATLRGQAALMAQQILEKKEQEPALVAQIESSMRRGKSAQAMRQALELESLRNDIRDKETELPRLEHAIWCMDFRLRQIVRRIDAIGQDLAKK